MTLIALSLARPEPLGRTCADCVQFPTCHKLYRQAIVTAECRFLPDRFTPTITRAQRRRGIPVTTGVTIIMEAVPNPEPAEPAEPSEILVTGADEADCRHEAEHDPVEGCERPCCIRATEEAYRRARLQERTRRIVREEPRGDGYEPWSLNGDIHV